MKLLKRLSLIRVAFFILCAAAIAYFLLLFHGDYGSNIFVGAKLAATHQNNISVLRTSENVPGAQKTILIWSYWNDRTMPPEYAYSVPQPTNANNMLIDSPDCGNCSFVFERGKLSESSAVVFHATLSRNDLPPRRDGQIFVWWSEESPAYHSFTAGMTSYFDWRMTYQRQSEVYSPYGSLSWILRLLRTGDDRYLQLAKMKGVKLTNPSELEEEISKVPLDREFDEYRNSKHPELEKLIRGKKRSALWMQSNCVSLRHDIVKIINENIGFPVDIFGRCFKKPFPVQSRWDPSYFRYSSTYKFFFSFENVLHCRDYMTEKLWSNALYSGTVPVIWGPHREDIKEYLPPKSYIHVEDFPTLGDLVSHLTYLSHNATAYAEYLQWRTWTKYIDDDGRYVPSKVLELPPEQQPSKEERDYLMKFVKPEPMGFCQLCAKLHGIMPESQKNKLEERPECTDSNLAKQIMEKMMT